MAGELVSIHAPARGATDRRPQGHRKGNRFNPRPRAGSDVAEAHDLITAFNVSIHAPARGATHEFRLVASV